MKETLEEAEFTLIEKELIKEAKKVWNDSHPNPIEMALFGANWQAEKMYSEEEVLKVIDFVASLKYMNGTKPQYQFSLSEILEQFKNKRKL